MKVLVIFTHLFLLAFILKEISSFVTRLPACKYSANYTMRHEGKYFNGIVNITVPNVSRSKCTLYCTVHDGCVFFNHKTDGTMCELMTSHIGTFEDKPGWDFVSTNYTEWKFRGPMCRFLRPLCNFDIEHCIDTCEAPGYKCKALVDVARGKVTTASSIWNSREGHANVVDGNSDTLWSSKKEETPWILIDLSSDYKILFITIINRQDAYNTRMKFVTIRIGNNKDQQSNEICLDKINQNGINKMNYFCKGGRMIGRYVFLTRKADMDTMTFAGIMVYSL